MSLAKRGAEELYDVEKDPKCITDLSGNLYGKEDDQNFYLRVIEVEKVENRSAAYCRPDLEDGI